MNKEERLFRFEQLKTQLQHCRVCHNLMKDELRPVFQGHLDSKIFQISQAPSRRVMETGLPFNDASGRKLKQEWYQVTDEQFYDPRLFYIASIARCYPGKAKNSGDLQPPKQCAELYLRRELELVQPQRIVLIGRYAAQWLFPALALEDLIFHTQDFREIPVFVLPHPSPLNRKCLKDHPDFEQCRMPEIRAQIQAVIHKGD